MPEIPCPATVMRAITVIARTYRAASGVAREIIGRFVALIKTGFCDTRHVQSRDISGVSASVI